jgi:hypothetical protein
VTTTPKNRNRQRIATCIVFLGTMLWSLYWPQEVSAQQRSIPVTVLVFNYSAASPSILKIAEHQTSLIFREAGLQVSWLWCSVPATRDSDESCAAEVGPQKLHLRIVNSPERNYFGEGIFGFTVAPAIATVYYGPCIEPCEE